MAVDLGSEDLRSLAARASTLDERLRGGYEPDGLAPEEGARRLDAWCRAAAAGNWTRFRQRLAAEGIDAARVPALLGPVRLHEATPLPSWAERLPEMVRQIAAGPPEEEFSSTPPFAGLFVPLAARLTAGLAQRPAGALWTTPALRELGDGLIAALSDLFTPVLFERFAIFRALRAPLNSGEGTAATRLYEAFLDHLRAGALLGLLKAKPVLARLLVAQVDTWTLASAELVDRLASDLPVLIQTFFGGVDPGRVANAAPACSDAHNHGRWVAVLRFEGRERIVYKPKDLRIDQAWEALLGRLARGGAPCVLRAPRTLPREGYGWCEYIAAAPCADAAAATRFYERVGALLSLFHLCSATDFHHENLLAAGEHPVPIDLETLLRPGVPLEIGEPGPRRAQAMAARIVDGSVIASGLLPGWMETQGKVLGIGGLSIEDTAEAHHLGLEAVNTDAMRYSRLRSRPRGSRNLPRIGGEVLRPLDFQEAIERGFQLSCRFLIAHGEELASGPLQAFRQGTIRVVLRPTRFYELLLRRARSAGTLGDGADFSIELDFLARLEKPETAPLCIVRAEREALARLDIPFFVAGADGTALQDSAGEVVDLAGEPWRALSGFAQLSRRLPALDETAVAQQCELIRHALESAGRSVGLGVPWPPEGRTPAWSQQEAFDRAVAIGDLLVRTAIRREGGAAWIGSVPLGGGDRILLAALGHELYSGAIGVALFLAALYRLTGAASYRELVEASLASLRDTLSRDPQGRTLGLGANGLGSIVFALVRIAALLGRPELLDDARRAAELITEEAVAADTAFDFIGGSAGGILGLLALSAAGDPDALARARSCGLHLLSQQIGDGPGRGGWESAFDRPLTGFSHGAAGIGYALFGLAAATGEKPFFAAAMEAVAYERNQFDELAGNWRSAQLETAGVEAKAFPCRWCHGAPGIGLARLGRLAVLDDAETRREIEVALATTAREPMWPIDHLCCGNFGRLDFLLTAGCRLERSGLVELARQRAAQRLDRTREGFCWVAGTDALNPGLFQGVAGIGYQLLRLALPETFPSILLW